jgi:hypothetical protein
MSRYGRGGGDDGTFWMGLGAAMLAIVAFFMGYQVHAAGYRFGPITQVQEAPPK